MSSERFHPDPERHRTPRPSASVRLRTLPPDLLNQSCRRVGIVATAFAAVWLVGILVNAFYHQWLLRTMPQVAHAWPWPGLLVHGAGIASSLGMLWLIGRLAGRPYATLDAGLGYMVLTAFLIGLMNGWIGEVVAPRGLSWTAAVILFYPAVAPSSIGRTMTAVFVAALMDPLGYAIASARGVEVVGGTTAVFWATVPNLIAASLAIVPIKIITTLGGEVTTARELGSYRLGELLASGGMGEVYRARHRLLARPAAIKLLRPDVVGARSPDQAQVIFKRFEREAAAAASLRSPHSVELYDFGVGENGDLYLVMELLEGLDLDTLVERFGPLPPERVVHLLLQACESLAEAHDNGLIHRDIKPSNLHVGRLGRRHDFLKVLDFGLVKPDHRRQAVETKLTAPEAVTGTPAFMAPELALGHADADHRVDLYALGCVAYWLLTGRLVFEADTPVAMLMRHVEDAVVPPSRRSELDIPAELEQLILDLLAKRPQDRPRDADELARRLGAVPLTAPWTEERAARWWASHQPAPAEPEPEPEEQAFPVAATA
jgi:serine/threonine-protein kinase